MGIFDFVKDAGRRLGILEEEAPPAPEAPKPDPAAAEARANRGMAIALAQQVNAHGLLVEDLAIDFSNGTATIRGKADSQEQREKVVLAVGNVRGVARVDDRMEVAAPQSQFHTVASGDTLSAIAKQFYGDAMKYPVIFEANKPMLEHPDKIYPGQVLRIPPLG